MSRKIDVIKKQLIKRYPHFGSIIDCVDYVETRNCLDYNGNPTLGTTGNTIYYHPDFLDKLTESQKLFAFAHEICHIAFNHMERGKGKDTEIWNYATDAVINAFLKKDGLELIDGVVNYPWAIRYDAEELYEKLLKKKQRKQKNKDNKQETKDNETQKDAGHDTHRYWGSKSKKPNDKIIETVQKEFQELGEKKVLKKKGTELKDILEKIKKALEPMTKSGNDEKEPDKSQVLAIPIGPGTTSEETKVKFDNVGDSYPLINWPLILKRQKEIVDYDWSYQNATIEDGILMSHLDETSYKVSYETEIVLDTSSSISDELLRSFLRECKNILNFSKIKVGCFDVKFYGFKEIRNLRDIDNFEFVGRGGTDFNVAVNAFSPDADNKIIFTDADGYAPDKEVNAIWIIFGNKKINPKGGKVIYIDSEKLINLSQKYYPKVLEKHRDEVK